MRPITACRYNFYGDVIDYKILYRVIQCRIKIIDFQVAENGLSWRPDSDSRRASILLSSLGLKEMPFGL